jgi:hypothetical protein
MPANYVLLAEQTLSTAVSSVTFSNIPQTGYTDLVIKFSARGDAGAISRSVGLTFNGSSTGYSNRYLQGDGSSATSGSGSSIYLGECTAATATANTFANQEVYISNYTSSIFKSLSVDSAPETNATTQYLSLVADLWSNTASINSMTFVIATGNFVAGSTFYIYGVAALGTTPVIAPKATGGDIITNDGTYWYHAFLGSGTFIPNQSLSCDYLVVAGGGGSGYSRGGGGGAGGLRSTVTATGGGGTIESAISLSAQTYAVTIGAGGAGGIFNGVNGSQGSNSIFSTITSIGGGFGPIGDGTAGTGGSGGGAAGTGSGAAGTANQGYAGGNFSAASNQGGSGGGGAGAIGSNNSSVGAGGNGGAGVAISAFATATSTGVSNFYGGGGGGGGAGSGNLGGQGGAGGGGNGGQSNNAVGLPGIVNTGGGGGGGQGTSLAVAGGAGGSGIVIVRYTVA